MADSVTRSKAAGPFTVGMPSSLKTLTRRLTANQGPDETPFVTSLAPLHRAAPIPASPMTMQGVLALNAVLGVGEPGQVVDGPGGYRYGWVLACDQDGHISGFWLPYGDEQTLAGLVEAHTLAGAVAATGDDDHLMGKTFPLLDLLMDEMEQGDGEDSTLSGYVADRTAEAAVELEEDTEATWSAAGIENAPDDDIAASLRFGRGIPGEVRHGPMGTTFVWVPMDSAEGGFWGRFVTRDLEARALANNVAPASERAPASQSADAIRVIAPNWEEARRARKLRNELLEKFKDTPASNQAQDMKNQLRASPRNTDDPMPRGTPAANDDPKSIRVIAPGWDHARRERKHKNVRKGFTNIDGAGGPSLGDTLDGPTLELVY